jgi:hypothetical protein
MSKGSCPARCGLPWWFYGSTCWETPAKSRKGKPMDKWYTCKMTGLLTDSSGNGIFGTDA